MLRTNEENEGSIDPPHVKVDEFNESQSTSLSLDVDNLDKQTSSCLENMNKVIELILNKMTDLEIVIKTINTIIIDSSDDEAFASQIYKILKTSPKSDPPPKMELTKVGKPTQHSKEASNKGRGDENKAALQFSRKPFDSKTRKEASSAHRQTNVCKKETPLPPIGISSKVTKVEPAPNMTTTSNHRVKVQSSNKVWKGKGITEHGKTNMYKPIGQILLEDLLCKFLPTIDMGLTTTQLKVHEYVFNYVQNFRSINDFLFLCPGESIRTKVTQMVVIKGTWKQHHVSTMTILYLPPSFEVDSMKGKYHWGALTYIF
ncbi:hypothetical protein SESBI_17354 [Sesbania bispinosa]|nr:hypothetical protein SESBI_17354 [Sesbania bispinosa]